MPGKLLVVGTPLGNLGDFPPRAVEALQSASLILCEDTRHTRKLLTHFGIDRPTDRLDEHTEDARSAQFIDRIEAGETIAIVSDAGMPVVSDPGYRMVRLPFTFLGFTPHRRGERLDFYRELAALGHTAIVYESPERVVDSLRDARDVVGGGVEVTVAREMTKLHEELIHGTIDEVLAKLEPRATIYGEVTIVFGAAKQVASSASAEEIAKEFERLRDGGMRRNDAIKVVAEKFGMRKNDVYRMLEGVVRKGGLEPPRL